MSGPVIVTLWALGVACACCWVAAVWHTLRTPFVFDGCFGGVSSWEKGQRWAVPAMLLGAAFAGALAFAAR